MKDGNQSRLEHFIRHTDELLVPITAGMLTLLVIVQCLTRIPTVRHVVDTKAGRFVEVTSASMTAASPIKLDLYVSPDIGGHAIKVYKNKKYVFTLTSNHQTMEVQIGDVLHFTSQEGSTDIITFNTTASNVIVPGSGYEITLSTDEPDADVGPIRALGP